MKVLIIARGYPTIKYSLNGIFEFDQAKALVEAGVEVVYAVIDVRSIRRWRKWGYESFIKDGVQIEAINVPCGRIPRRILNSISEISLGRLYKRIFKKYGKPDIIHSHFIGFGYITTTCFRNTDIPLVHTEHLSSVNKKVLSEYHRYLGINTYRYINKVIAVSKPLANSLKDKFGIKVTVIPNIVDTSTFKYVPYNSLSNAFNFISVGNLISRKRIELLVNSFNESFSDNKEVKLYIYGDGPEKKALDNLINKLNLTKQVFLMGLVDRQTIAKKMQECNCFVLASMLETFGVVYIEAMAAGLPVIATKCGGPEDFINESNGILIQVDNQEELTKALIEMYNNTKKYNREKISKEITDKFNSQNIAKSIIYEYQKLLKGEI